MKIKSLEVYDIGAENVTKQLALNAEHSFPLSPPSSASSSELLCAKDQNADTELPTKMTDEQNSHNNDQIIASSSSLSPSSLKTFKNGFNGDDPTSDQSTTTKTEVIKPTKAVATDSRNFSVSSTPPTTVTPAERTTDSSFLSSSRKITSALDQLSSPSSSPNIIPLNNGLSSSSTVSTSSTAAMATTTSAVLSSPSMSIQHHHPFVGGHSSSDRSSCGPPSQSSQPPPTRIKGELVVIGGGSGGGGAIAVRGSSADNGVTDYTQKNSNKSAVYGGNMDIGRIPISLSAASTVTTTIISGAGGAPINNSDSRTAQGVGGRLQFFKDGKFILELARAKEGEKSGWVSVPRKLFRSPSATSSTITPTYPKNESSTSLSFSDDNSSIQSSPWQRDHCWKQSTPRRGISKEMCLYYKRIKHIALSSNGVKTARRKKRRPFDTVSSCSAPFREVGNGFDPPPRIKILNKELHNDNNVVGTDKNEEINPVLLSIPEKSSSSSVNQSSSSLNRTETETTATTINVDSSSTAECIDGTGVDGIISTVSKVSVDAVDGSDVTLSSTTTPHTEADKMHIGEEVVDYEESTRATTKQQINGEKRLKQKPRAKLTTIIQKLIDRLPTGLFYLSKTPQIIGGVTTNNNHMSAVLGSAASSVLMTTTSSGLSTGAATLTTTSRLAEQHYHQQHVSPRKRILREFEKVSLEDNAVGSSKRSRAKGNATTTAIVSGSNAVTSHGNHRVQSSGCAVFSSSSSSTNIESRITTNGSTIRTEQLIANNSGSSGNSNNNSATPTPSTRLYSSYSIHSLLGGNNTSSTAINNSSRSSGKSGKSSEVTSIINHHQQQQHQHQQYLQSQNHQNIAQQHHHQYTDPSYLRAMLASPKSPESSGGVQHVHAHAHQASLLGKSSPYSSSSSFSSSSSSSNSSVNPKKRSPPYSSPLLDHNPHYAHSHSTHHSHATRNQSPTVDAAAAIYSRSIRSPPSTPTTAAGVLHSRSTPPQQQHPYLSSPKHHSSTNSSSINSDTYKITRTPDNTVAAHSPNNQFYSPYMVSPKYVPAPSAASPNHHGGHDYSSRQKHEHHSRSPNQNLRLTSTSSNRSPSLSAFSSSNSSAAPLELSPPARTATGSPAAAVDRREASNNTTPRTVPKKTVSIRRQFASPSSSSSPSSTASLTNAASFGSATDQQIGQTRQKIVVDGEDLSPDNRKTPTGETHGGISKYHSHQAAAVAAAAMLHRSSGGPVGGGQGSVSSSSPLYYMYPPNGGSASPHSSASSPSTSTTSYIPPMSPYYHPYVSTLAALRNPLWMHHAAAAAAAGYPPTHGPQPPGMLPSGLGHQPPPSTSTRLSSPFQHFPYNGVGAAAVAAAAAAAATASNLHSSFAPMHLSSAHHHQQQQQHHHHQLAGLPPQSSPSIQAGLLRNHSPMTDDHRTGTMSPSSIKEDHSSDVPLNLSKH